MCISGHGQNNLWEIWGKLVNDWASAKKKPAFIKVRHNTVKSQTIIPCYVGLCSNVTPLYVNQNKNHANIINSMLVNAQCSIFNGNCRLSWNYKTL